MEEPKMRSPSIKFADWPARDQELWTEGLRDKGILENIGVGTNWRSQTRLSVVGGYCCALSWLKDRGLLDVTVEPYDRWHHQILKAYVDYLEATFRGSTPSCRLLALERAIAVMAPAHDRVLLRRAVSRTPSRPDVKRKRLRLRTSDELMDLGVDLMLRAANAVNQESRKTASRYRTGLQIALLAARPLRMRNLSMMRINRHLVREGDRWIIQFTRNETKTSQPITAPFPEELASYLERYLKFYRLKLAGRSYTGDRLWVSYRYRPQAAHTIQLAIVKETGLNFEHPVNPHLFRDAAATTIAIYDPKNVRSAATVLGHRSFASTERTYNLARGLDACRAYQDVLKGYRSG